MHEFSMLQRMKEYAPVPWALVPDLGLYMDQVITYIERQLEPLYGEAAKGLLTPSMINNYVKSGLVHRPLGKKYYREHLAILMMIVTLKPVASMDDILKLTKPHEDQSIEHLYDEFCAMQKNVFLSITLDPKTTALEHAVTATAYQLIAEAALKEAK